MLPCCQSDPKEHISVKLYLKFKSFQSRKHTWICCLQNGSHYISASMCLWYRVWMQGSTHPTVWQTGAIKTSWANGCWQYHFYINSTWSVLREVTFSKLGKYKTLAMLWSPLNVEDLQVFYVGCTHEQTAKRTGYSLTLKHRETHGCVVSTAATDALVLKHQAISILSTD